MTEWHIQLLGGFDVRRDQVSLHGAFQTDSARLLFAWLCLHQGQVARRETLLALLWPDRPQAAAQNALRVTLSRIRQALGDAQSALNADAQTVTFAPPLAWQIDALRLAQAVAAVRSHPHRSVGGCPQCLDHLRAAATLYRGPFLAGLVSESETLSDWIRHQEEDFHRAALECFGALAEHALRARDWPTAQAYARRQLQLEPWCESAHRQLMLALAYQGQRAAALAQYQTCCELLQREFGVEPEADTRAVAERVRMSDLSVAQMPHPAQQQAQNIDQLPLIGRERELEALSELLNRPGVQLISIVGAGGIGKTRLAIRAAQQMQFAFRDGARYVFLHPEDGAAATASDPASYLARCIADACQIELNDRHPLPPQIGAALTTRSYLLVLDSAEHIADAHLFLNDLLTAAPECVALVTSRQRLHLRREHVLRLKPFTTETTAGQPSPGAQLFLDLARRNGIALTDEGAIRDVEWICAMLDGTPLAIELAAARLSSVDLVTLRRQLQQNVTSLSSSFADMPARHRSLTAMLESTWQTLSPAGRQALAMVSVVSGPCALATARSIIDREPALTELFEMALLHPMGNSAVRFHEHVRQFAGQKLAADFAAAVGVEAHRRHARWFLRWLADSTEAMYGAESLITREHLLSSLNDLDAAWQWALMNGEWDWVSNAVPAYENLFYFGGRFVDGIERLSRSLAYVSQPDQPAMLRLRARLLISYAYLQSHRRRSSDIEARLQEAVDIAGQLGDAWLRIEALAASGIYHSSEGNYERGYAILREALTLLSERGFDADQPKMLRVACQCWRSLSNLALRESRAAEAVAAAQTALEYAIQIDPECDLAVARSLETVSIALSMQEQYQAAEQHLWRALAIYQQLRLTHQQTNVLDLLAQQADARGDYATAQRYYYQELALARESGNRDAELIAHINLGISYDQMGHYERALSHTQIALALCDTVGNAIHHTVLLANLSLHAHHTQRHELALTYAQKTIAQAQARNLPELVAYGYDFQGHALLALGQLDAAERSYQQASAIRQQLQLKVLTLESQAGLARVALARNDVPGALRLIAPIVEHLLAGNNLNGAEETLRIYWTAYQALRAARDPRAAAILTLAQQLIRERAARLIDPISRAIYLNVEIHHALLTVRPTDQEGREPAVSPQPTAA